MNTFNIILKEFRQSARDWRANALMILFPIVLMAVLGAAFSGSFSRTLSLSGTKVLYTATGANGPLSNAFLTFIRGAAKSTGILFVKARDANEGVAGVQDAAYACYVAVESGSVKLYLNAQHPLEAGIVRSMLTAFLLRYHATATIFTARGSAPAPIEKPAADGDAASYVAYSSLAAKRSPGAMDYYAVTMLTLIVLYSALVGMGKIRMEIQLKTANRILSAPTSRSQYLVGKVFGSLLVVLAQMAVLIIFSNYVLGAYWGNDLPTIALLILAESTMAVAIGIAIAFLIPAEGPGAAVLNVVIPILAFFGGSYAPLDSLGPAMASAGAFSPVKWINQAMFGVIYNHDYSAVGHAVLVNVAIAAVCIATAALIARKENT